ncbi:hypothetical protein GW17_00022874, partial [Ensete ventricosum]
MATLSKLYSMREATEHNTRDDCWVVIHGKVRSFYHSFSFFTHIVLALFCLIRPRCHFGASRLLRTRWMLRRDLKADEKPSEETAKKGEDKSGLENRNNVSYKQENCWFSLKLWICHCCSLQVYDVTSYLEEHPGGDDVLLSAAG